MTRPDPLGVECPYCWAAKREPCYVGSHRYNERAPHAARVRAAQQVRRGKEEKT